MASILNVDQINNAAGTSAVTIDASTGKPSFPNGATLPAGSVVQVVNTSSSTKEEIAGTTMTEITSLATSITPKLTGSHILCTVNVMSGSDYSGGGIWYQARLYRNSTSNPVGPISRWYDSHQYDSIGPKPVFNIIDTTDTTAGVARTYRVYIAAQSNASGAIKVNWDAGDSQSSITLMEIAQ